MGEEKRKIVDIKELGLSGGDFDLPLLSELVGQEITIREVRFRKGKYGEYAVVTLEDGKEYRTSSEVIIDQLKEIEKALEDSMVKARVKRVKNYYVLA